MYYNLFYEKLDFQSWCIIFFSFKFVSFFIMLNYTVIQECNKYLSIKNLDGNK